MYRNCPSAHPIRRPLEPQTVHLSFGQRVRRVRLVRSARVHVVGNRAANATIGAEPRVNGQYTALLHGGAAVHGRPVGAGVLGARRRRRERVRPDGEGGSAERCAHGGVAIGAMSGQLCCRRPSPIFFGGLWGLGEMVVGLGGGAQHAHVLLHVCVESDLRSDVDVLCRISSSRLRERDF